MRTSSARPSQSSPLRLTRSVRLQSQTSARVERVLTSMTSAHPRLAIASIPKADGPSDVSFIISQRGASWLCSLIARVAESDSDRQASSRRLHEAPRRNCPCLGRNGRDHRLHRRPLRLRALARLVRVGCSPCWCVECFLLLPLSLTCASSWFLGGSGISYTAGLLSQIVRDCDAGKSTVKHVSFIWVVRSTGTSPITEP
jgi:hypothetical protein